MSNPALTTTSRSCLKCGTQNPPEATTCHRCGQKLSPIKISHREAKKKLRLHLHNPQLLDISPDQMPTTFDINTIYCGDCLKVMRQIPDASIDLIVTSPPYNFGLDGYDTHTDTKTWEDYFSALNKAWQQCLRVLNHGGRICVVVQPLFSDYIPTHHIISQQLRDLGFLFKAEILWEKHNYNCKYTAWGSWKSPSMPYLKYTWEFIEVFCKGDYRKNGKPDKADITSDEFKKWVYGKWDIAPESRMKKFGHPSMFPEDIPYRLIKLFSYVDDLVLDPFNGVGTTTLVAHKLRRNYIGIDISERYCQKAINRIAEQRQLELL